MNKFIKIKTRLSLLLIWLIIIGFSSLLIPWKDIPTQKAKVLTGGDSVPVIKYINYFSDIELLAGIAVVWDVKNQRFLYQKNSNQQVPLASITKIMTALVAIENLDQDTPVIFDQRAIRLDDSLSLPTGSSWKAADLIDLFLVRSSNAAARAIALAVENKTNQSFSNLMNEKARELEMESYFINESGLDVGGGGYGGSFGSAKDIIKLFEYIMINYPDLLTATKYESINRRALTGEISTAFNTNKTVVDVKGIMASKTGFTGQAGGNLAIMFDARLNHPVIIIVLSSSREERFQDVINLYEAAREQIINEH